MNKPKVLYLHHAKDFSSNPVYLSDDFISANKSLFGAQEMDSWAGYRILARQFLTYRLQISTNLSAVQLILPNGESLDPIDICIPRSLNSKMNPRYIKTLMRYFDTSYALFSDYTFSTTLESFVKEYSIDFVWSDTQFYLPAIPPRIRTLIRSVNFEPLHVLREDPSAFRFLRSFGKLYSEKKAVRERSLVAISPRDANSYKKLSNHRIECIPLRQLGFLIEQSPSWERSSIQTNRPFFYFAGSNFDVKHNRDNLILLLDEVAPALAEIRPDALLLIFGHRLPRSVNLPPNVKYMHFCEDYFSLTKMALGSIVPHRGGAGMQSKIFEPLCLGIPLVANREAIAGYPFNSQEHFWNGDSPQEIVESIRAILEDRNCADTKAREAQQVAQQLFLLESLKNQVMRNLFLNSTK